MVYCTVEMYLLRDIPVQTGFSDILYIAGLSRRNLYSVLTMLTIPSAIQCTVQLTKIITVSYECTEVQLLQSDEQGFQRQTYSPQVRPTQPSNQSLIINELFSTVFCLSYCTTRSFLSAAALFLLFPSVREVAVRKKREAGE